MKTAIVLICLAALLAGCSVGGTATPSPAGVVTVTGRVVVIGNEPFTALAVSTADNVTFELTGEKAGELRALQGVTVEVSGRSAGRGRYAAQSVEVTGYRRVP